MTPRLLYLGITQDRASLDVRERVCADRPKRRELLEGLRGHVHESLLLSTCERFELYALTGRHPLSLLKSMSPILDMPATALNCHFRVLEGEAVAGHLLRVAAGLESRILGESHILGQVRRAFLDAAEWGHVGPVLSALARAAIHAGKRLRCETDVAAPGRCAVSLAIDYLERVWGESVRNGRNIVVLGTGQLARDAVTLLNRRGAARIVAVSRTEDRARAFAQRHGCEAASTAALKSVLAEADGVVACSWGTYIDSAVIGPRESRPLAIVDLGMPRNVDPSVRRLPGVSETHLEELKPPITESASSQADVQRLLDCELGRFMAWYRQREVAPIIARLVAQAQTDPYIDGRELHERIMRVKSQVAA